MKNPLWKRLPRELKSDFAKYLIIFLFMVLTISLISAFLVADISVMKAYEDGFTKYNIEDGHISFNQKLPEEVKKRLETEGQFTLYDLSFFEEKYESTGANIRVYQLRTVVNLECLMSGSMPQAENEIALDRMFAQNNKIQVGDHMKVGGKDLLVSGLIALPDYSCLFEKSSDMMFDSVNFCVAVMTREGYEAYDSKHITYNYAWKYKEGIDCEDKVNAKKLSEDLIDKLPDILLDYSDPIIDRAIAAGKLLGLREAFDQMEAEGMNLALLNNQLGREMILKSIQKQLQEQGTDLKSLFTDQMGQIDKEITLTTEDIRLALEADDEEVARNKMFLENIREEILDVNDYLPRYLNQAINFTGEDMGGDKIMFIIFDYLIMVVLAFIFAVTISNTIASEAGTIGTLRASGYSRGEIIRHYLLLPLAVTLFAAVIGNILGYTVVKSYMINMYYNSYSLATYKTLWSAEAFVDTTLIPIILMLVINFFVLNSKLKLSPLRFLRRDLSKKGKKKAFRLNTKIPIMHRVRLRILFQNIPNYITLFFGILLAATFVIFSSMFVPLLKDYAGMVVDTRICDYQYILLNQKEVEEASAEKFCMTSLQTTNEKYMIDDVSIYGIEKNSRYITKEIPFGKVLVSNGMAAKFGLKEGSVLTLKDPYSTALYEFTVAGEYVYDGGLCVFMDREEYNVMFGEKPAYFTGYFSNTELSELTSDDIATTITVKELTKISTQLEVSMGSFMTIFKAFGVLMFVLMMFLLGKQIIEKNAQSISMVKILGFTNGEIAGMYIAATTFVVLAALFLAIPIVDSLLRVIFKSYLYTEMKGYIPYIVSPSCYVQMVTLGIASYVFVSILQFIKISHIRKSDALKNVE